jgi:LuxR family transcriptional regulator, maltose regulon positive regulatory protein
MRTSDARPSAKSLRAKLLGTAQIAYDRERIDPRLSSQTLLVFACLAIRPGEILNREEVAFTLWPDHRENEARANLRRHLYLLQRALPPAAKPWIRSDAKTVSWAASDEAWLDVSEFERLSAAPEGVEAAIESYSGEFMPRVDHEWASKVRSRLHALFCRDLERATALRCARGDLVGSLRHVETLLSCDPWREDAIRDLMLLRYRIGDRAGALASYRDFRHRLRDEFGVDPMPETMGFHETVRRGQIPTDFHSFRSEVGACLPA